MRVFVCPHSTPTSQAGGGIGGLLQGRMPNITPGHAGCQSACRSRHVFSAQGTNDPLATPVQVLSIAVLPSASQSVDLSVKSGRVCV